MSQNAFFFASLAHNFNCVRFHSDCGEQVPFFLALDVSSSIRNEVETILKGQIFFSLFGFGACWLAAVPCEGF